MMRSAPPEKGYLRSMIVARRLGDDVIEESGHNFISLTCSGVEKKFRLLDGKVTNFCDESFASFGASSSKTREVIILNPSSVLLQKKYAELKSIISGSDSLQSTIIAKTMEFVRVCLNAKIAGMMEPFLPRFSEQESIGKHSDQHIVALDSFVEKGIGVCRHHALFFSFLLSSLIKERYLPGTVYHHRDDVRDGSAHAWVMYRPDTSSLFWLDSLSDQNINCLNPTGRSILNGFYGATAVTKCYERYFPSSDKKIESKEATPPLMPSVHAPVVIHPPRPASLPMIVEKEIDYHISMPFDSLPLDRKKEIVRGLLKLNSDKRQKILKDLHDEGPCNLMAIGVQIRLSAEAMKQLGALVRESEDILNVKELKIIRAHIPVKDEKIGVAAPLRIATPRPSAPPEPVLKIKIEEKKEEKEDETEKQSILSLIAEIKQHIENNIQAKHGLCGLWRNGIYDASFKKYLPGHATRILNVARSMDEKCDIRVLKKHLENITAIAKTASRTANFYRAGATQFFYQTVESCLSPQEKIQALRKK